MARRQFRRLSRESRRRVPRRPTHPLRRHQLVGEALEDRRMLSISVTDMHGSSLVAIHSATVSSAQSGDMDLHVLTRPLGTAASGLSAMPTGLDAAEASSGSSSPPSTSAAWVPWNGEEILSVAGRWIVQWADGTMAGAGLTKLLAASQDTSSWTARGIGGDIFRLTTGGASVGDVVAWASATHAISIEPDVILQRGLSAETANNPNDRITGRSGDWVYDAINVPDAWTVTRGTRDVVVGIIDTGLDYLHPDLVDNVWVNFNEVPGNRIDDDGNGYVDDVNGYDFWNNDGDPFEFYASGPSYGHGTCAAGIVGAVGNNGKGMTGVSQLVSLMGLKIFSDGGQTTSISAMTEAINYATMMRTNYGVNIVATNNSYGGQWSINPSSVTDPVRKAIDAGGQAGILYVASAGNDFVDNDLSPFRSFPASFDSPWIVSVAASTWQDGLARFSNYGLASVDIAAPGVAGYTTYPLTSQTSSLRGYNEFSGTSMAAPYVAGAVALLAASAPAATATQIKDAILSAARKCPAVDGLVATGGILDVSGAMKTLSSGLGLAFTTPADVAINGGQAAVVRLATTDAGRGTAIFEIAGGRDSQLFTVDPWTGDLAFTNLPDEMRRTDSNGDGTYEVSVRATDFGATVARDFRIRIKSLQATFSAVSTPRASAVSAVDISFPRPVTGFTVANLRLMRDGIPVDLGLATLRGSGTQWRLTGLDATTASPGRYRLSIMTNASSIVDQYGNRPAGQNGLEWSTIADISDLAIATPGTLTVAENTSTVARVSLRSTPSDFDVSFVISGGADAAWFSLSPDGSLTFVSPPDFEAAGDANADNRYEVKIAAGNGPYAAAKTFVVTVGDVDEEPPRASFATLPSLRQDGLQGVALTFSEDVQDFDLFDIVLTRNSLQVPLFTYGATWPYAIGQTFATLSGSGRTYFLDGLSSLTATPGDYELSVLTKSSYIDTLGNRPRDVVDGSRLPLAPESPTRTIWHGVTNQTGPYGGTAQGVDTPAAASIRWTVDTTGLGLPRVLKDINQTVNLYGNGRSDPNVDISQSIATVNGVILFAASDFMHGTELWRTDGTEPGTWMLKDIQLGEQQYIGGADSSYPRDFFVWNDVLYFKANTGGIGDYGDGGRLWRSDGTLSGTYMLSSDLSDFSSMTVVGDRLYFAGQTAALGRELWTSDGTVAGTRLAADIFPGRGSSNPDQLTQLGSVIYLTADNGTSGQELFAYDTVSGVCRLIVDLVSGVQTNGLPKSSSPYNLTAFNGQLVFNATSSFLNGSMAGIEPWISDGTAAGTRLLKDINPGSGSSYASGFTQLGAKLVFAATTATQGKELWVTDGTAAETFCLRDILTGTGDSSPMSLTAFNGRVYFTADDGSRGRELWATDGTTAGTGFLFELNPSGSAAPTAPGDNFIATLKGGGSFPSIDGELYFCADDGSTGIELYRSNGTDAGTVRIADIAAGSVSSFPGRLVRFGNRLAFDAQDGVRSSMYADLNLRGRELYVYDLPTTTPRITSADLVEVPENQTAVYRATASPAKGLTQKTWSLAGGNDASLFTINTSTGQVAFRVAPNHEVPRDANADNTYEVTIRVTSGTASATQAVRIRVTDVGETDPAWVTAAAISISSGTTILPLAATADRTGCEWYRISGGADAPLFRIDSGTAVLRFMRPPVFSDPGDRNLDNVYEVQVTVTDGGRVATRAFQITVLGSNAFAPTFIGSPTGDVWGGALAGDLLWQLRATDDDSGTMPITYSVKPSVGDAGMLSVHPQTGEVRLTSASIPTGRSTLTFTAIATDGGPAPRTTESLITLSIRRDRDLLILPPNIVTISSTCTARTTIHTARAVDAATGAPAPGVRYSIKADDGDAAMVVMDEYTGDVRLRESPDRRSKAVYTFTVVAADLAGREATQRITAILSPLKTLVPQSLYPEATAPLKFDNVSEGVQLGGFLYVFACARPSPNYSGPVYPALWRTDGTARGTQKVYEFRPVGVTDPYAVPMPAGLTVAAGKLFFFWFEGGTQWLWQTDGTQDGTNRVVSLGSYDVGRVSSYVSAYATPKRTAAFSDLMYFVKTGAFNTSKSDFEYALWVTDGTAAGTREILPFLAGSLVSTPNRLYFIANDGVHGRELWTADRAGNVAMVVDWTPSYYGSAGDTAIGFMTPYGDSVLFSISSPSNGQELGISDGTVAGTRVLKDIFPGGGPSDPTNFTQLGGQVYFSAFDATDSTYPLSMNDFGSRSLWRTDGTASGTVKVSSVRPVRDSSWGMAASDGGTLYFVAEDGVHGYELWQSDGTDAGTMKVPGSPRVVEKDPYVFIGPQRPAASGDVVLFQNWSRDSRNNVQQDGLYATTDGATTVLRLPLGPDGNVMSTTALALVNGMAVATNGVGLFAISTNSPPTAVRLSPASVAIQGGTFISSRTKVADIFIADDLMGTNTLTISGSGASMFEVVSNALYLKAGTFLNYDDRATYNVTISASDTSISGSLPVLTPFIMSVSSSVTNQAPTAIALSANSVAENAGANAVVGTLTTTDPDASDTFTYTLVTGTGSTDNASFNISGNQLRATVSFDFETTNSYSVRVRSTDQGGLFIEKAFTITVADVLDDVVLDSSDTTPTTAPSLPLGSLAKLVKRGSGTLILDKPNSHSGGTVVEAGEVIVRNAAALGTGALEIRAGAKVTLDVLGAEVSVGALKLADGACLDLGNGRVTLQVSAANVQDGLSFTRVQDLLRRAYEAGWTGVDGFATRTAGLVTGGGLAYLDNGDGSITVGFAAKGDTNLDGLVDVLDAANFLSAGKMDTNTAATWSEGDFNYDGVFDLLDVADFVGSGLFEKGPYRPSQASQAEVSPATLSAVDAAFAALATDMMADTTTSTTKKLRFASST